MCWPISTTATCACYPPRQSTLIAFRSCWRIGCAGISWSNDCFMTTFEWFDSHVKEIDFEFYFSNAKCRRISRDTKIFLNSLESHFKLCKIKFSCKNFCATTRVWRKNSYSDESASSQTFHRQNKILMFIHLVENFKSEERYAAKYRYQTEAWTWYALTKRE